MDSRFSRVLIVLIGILLLLVAGCLGGEYVTDPPDDNGGNGNGDDPNPSPGPDSGIDANVPALPLGSSQATDNLLALNGAQTFQLAGTATASGSELVLDAAEIQVSSWAIYEFSSISTTLYPVRLKCFVTEADVEYYLMYGHYNPTSWELHGPYTGDASLIFPDFVDVVSTGGRVYAAVVAPSGSKLTVENVLLELGSLPSDGTGVDDFVPALPPGTEAAGFDSLHFTGSQSYSESEDAVRVDSTMQLNAVGQQASVWSIYQFSSVDLTYYPNSVTVNVSQIGGEYYIMYGHYSPTSWELTGPYNQASITYEFPSGVQMRSPGNRTYVAVVAGSGNSVVVDDLTLNLSSGPAADSNVDDYVIALPDGTAPATADALALSGSAAYANSYAAADGTKLVLDAVGVKQSAWAVYEFTSADHGLYPQDVSIDVSADSDFYYLLWANYTGDSWEMVVRPGAEDSDPQKNRIIGDFTYTYNGHWDSLSDGGRTYVAVIAQAGTKVTVNGLTLTVADTPPPVL